MIMVYTAVIDRFFKVAHEFPQIIPGLGLLPRSAGLIRPTFKSLNRTAQPHRSIIKNSSIETLITTTIRIVLVISRIGICNVQAIEHTECLHKLLRRAGSSVVDTRGIPDWPIVILHIGVVSALFRKYPLIIAGNKYLLKFRFQLEQVKIHDFFSRMLCRLPPSYRKIGVTRQRTLSVDIPAIVQCACSAQQDP